MGFEQARDVVGHRPIILRGEEENALLQFASDPERDGRVQVVLHGDRNGNRCADFG